MSIQNTTPLVYPHDRILNIFISHKMPIDSVLAQKIGAKLAKYSAGRIVVRFAEEYPYGDSWRDHIKEDINQSDMLIYLHTGEYDDWLFCLFECGMFVNRPTKDRNDLGITTFCKKMEDVSAPIREFNALVISIDAIIKLYRQIYTEAPWAISPDLTDEDFRSDAKYIFDEFMKSYYIIHNFDVAPNITVEVEKDEETKKTLKLGNIPDKAVFGGTAGWQTLFDKDVDTGDLQWDKLKSRWAYSKVYEFLLSKVIDRAINGSSTRAILFRSINSTILYRLALRRYEELSNGRYKFYFTAAPIDLPFDTPSEGAERKEVTLYHLINLTWYFRRRFVDGLYNRLLDLIQIPEKDRNGTQQLCDEIAYELMDIDAQALCRGVDNPRITQEALGGDDPKVVEIMRRGKEWYDLRPKVLQMIRDSASLESIATELYNVTQMNYEFYMAAAEEFNDSAQKLKPPPRSNFASP
jgi:hypothetical protein